MKCERCGKEHDGNYGSGKFCSSQCAHSRIFTEEQKENISNGIKNLNLSKKCSECGKRIRKRSKSGLCFECLYKEKRTAYQHVKRYRERKRLIAKKLFNNKCKICGYDKCSKALEFHHLEPKRKDLDWAILKYHGNKTKYYDEILNKCILVCANCHREIHDGLHPKYLIGD